MEEDKKSNSLKWRFDVNAFRLLGRELITDRITALVELVKNSYDANATEVHVEFYNVGKKNPKSLIVIRDNGSGMTLDDVENKWMVVGTKSKRKDTFSPSPFKRKYIGEKGIGRFAVDKLGGCLDMTTKILGETEKVEVKIDWEDYEELAKNQTQLTLFTEIENSFNLKEGLSTESGTALSISKIHEIWTERDIKRVKTELSKIVSPFHRLSQPFKIFVSSNEYPQKFKGKEPLAYDKGTFDAEEFHITFGKEQEQLVFNSKTGKIEKELIPEQIFGFVDIRIFYFNTGAKIRFNKIYRPKGRNIDGFKMYRDGVLTTPFAEDEDNSTKQRDVFGVDKQLWASTYDSIGNREIIGIIDISKERNPLIKDATNRQGFITNPAYLKFKEFLFHQLIQLSKYKVAQRTKKKKEAGSILDAQKEDLKEAVKDFKKATKGLKKSNPLLVDYIRNIEDKATEAINVVGTLIKVNKEAEKETQRKENLYLSLMSLQDYAANLSHSVRTSLGKIKRLAEFFKKRFPNPKYEKQFITYSSNIFDEINTLEKVVDFMLSYAKAGLEIEDFNVKEIIENLFDKFYSHIFDLEDIRGIVEISDDFILNGNRKFIEDIFENLVSNSIKALSNEQEKIIKVSGGIEGNNFVCYFSDNGEGIKKGDEEKIFEIYYTTTANKGGAGLGLFIVRKRLEVLNGNIEVVNSEFSKGVTFKIVLPFKKNT